MRREPWFQIPGRLVMTPEELEESERKRAHKPRALTKGRLHEVQLDALAILTLADPAGGLKYTLDSDVDLVLIPGKPPEVPR